MRTESLINDRLLSCAFVRTIHVCSNKAVSLEHFSTVSLGAIFSIVADKRIVGHTALVYVIILSNAIFFHII
jgi:hypothetical protein